MSDAPPTDVTNEEALKAVQQRESRKTPKIVRVLTVCAYMATVSTAAIMLSAYYIFLWNPPLPTATTTQIRKH